LYALGQAEWQSGAVDAALRDLQASENAYASAGQAARALLPQIHRLRVLVSADQLDAAQALFVELGESVRETSAQRAELLAAGVALKLARSEHADARALAEQLLGLRASLSADHPLRQLAELDHLRVRAAQGEAVAALIEDVQQSLSTQLAPEHPALDPVAQGPLAADSH
jgi:outer membrane PBP1 activator LpoA protein